MKRITTSATSAALLFLGRVVLWADATAGQAPSFSLFTTNPPSSTAAVEGMNGKLDVSGGNLNSYAGENVAGSLSLPMGHSYGLQADGLYTQVGSASYGGAGLHAFWRDPQEGLFGFAAGGIIGTGLHEVRAVAEGEWYLRRITLSAALGGSALQYNHRAPFIDSSPVDVAAALSARWYPVENLKLEAAVSRDFGNYLGEVEAEYLTPLPGVSGYVNLAKGENGYDHELFGIRVYFGHAKSLIRHHREDDPPSLLMGILHSLGSYGAEFNHAMHRYTAQNPNSGYSPSGGDYGSQSTWIGVPTSNSNEYGTFPSLPPTPVPESF